MCRCMHTSQDESTQGKDDRWEPDDEKFWNRDVVLGLTAKVFYNVKTVTLHDVD